MSFGPTLTKLIEAALANWRVPASQIANQIPGSQVAPASSGSPGTVDPDDFEAALGDPAADGYALTSTASGVRLWLPPGTLVGGAIHAATAKTTPIDADETALIDSAASNALKRLTWANVKATLKAYFDTLYTAVGGAVTSVTGTAPISSSGGATPAISISAATTGAAGSMSAADKAKADAYPAVSGLTAGQALRATAAGAVGYGAIDLANASAITGTLADARLSSNVALKNAANVFTAAQAISNTAVDLLTADVTGAHGGSATLKLRKIRGTSIVQNGDYIGAFEGWGYDGAAYRRAGYFAWLVNGAPSSAVMPAAFIIAVNGGGADASEVARFTTAGVFLYGLRTSPASPAAGEVYKDASGFLKIG